MMVSTWRGMSVNLRLPLRTAARLERKGEAAELVEVRLEEGKFRERRQVETLGLERQTVGPRERHLDRNAHVGRTELGHEGAIAELHQRMHHRLRVNHHLDLFVRNVEQEVSFENFEAFVHHGGRIDGYLLAHAKRLDLPTLAKLTFFEPDFNKFRCLALAFEAGRRMP